MNPVANTQYTHKHSIDYDMLRRYVASPVFQASDALLTTSPWHRPMRLQDIEDGMFDAPLRADELRTNAALLANQILLNTYEQDMLFIQESMQQRSAFEAFYDPDFVALGRYLRPWLERFLFSFLDDEIEATGAWKEESAITYMSDVIKTQAQSMPAIVEKLRAFNDQRHACESLFVQQASDFLSEASAMARALPGSFGEVQSSLMKVFIDEFGYGVHKSKHSTLFEKTMAKANLDTMPHRYFSFYLPTSLMLTNYFHYICSNKNLWFRYLGALFYTEASIPHFNKHLSRFLKEAFNSRCPDLTGYFDEHVHIDEYHMKMVLDLLIRPTIDKYGTSVIADMLRGFESFRFLQEAADEDLVQQLNFADSPQFSVMAPGKGKLFVEKKGEISLPHIHEHNEVFIVEEGALEFIVTQGRSFEMSAKSSVLIPKGCLHGTKILSDICKYRVHQLGGVA